MPADVRAACFDNAAAEAFFSSLAWEVLSDTSSPAPPRPGRWRSTGATASPTTSAATGLSPINYETTALNRDAA
jgi:putative transposase